MHPFLYGTLITTLYIAVAVGLMMLARKLVKIPDERFKKNIDKYGEGTAEFAAEGIRIYVENK